MTRIVAVLDIGKTNAKLVVHDLAAGRDLHFATRPNTVRPGPPYPHFDVDALFEFFVSALREAASLFPIDAISVTTHGACFALLDDRGDLAMPILDYEASEPEETAQAYDAARPPFRETASPRLPNGLNAGAQLFWLQHRFPEAFARARRILPYPQYWVHRLTGVAASEVTSLGCHSDLWAPAQATFSTLARTMGWADRMAPIRSAFDAAGPLRPALAERAGLSGRLVPVHVGLHDSNASLLPHLLAGQTPISVVSTGTWIVAFASGGDLARLDPSRDMLANVDPFGRPVPSARFMGGREFDILTDRRAAEPTAGEIARVVAEGIMALPTFAPGTGPFPARNGGWTQDPAALAPGERTAAASLYVALMTATLLDAVQAGGPTCVEGPFADDRLMLDALATLTGREVRASPGASGTSHGAALLALAPERDPSRDAVFAGAGARPPVDGLGRYASLWRSRLEGGT